MKTVFVILIFCSAIVLLASIVIYREDIDLDQVSNYFKTNTSEKHQEGTKEDPPQKGTEDVVKLSPEQVKTLGLDIQTAEKGTLTLTLSNRGKITIDPDRLAHVIPKVPGMAKEARKNIGDPVKKGEIIAILESEDVADLKAGYLAALSKENLNRSISQREETLYQKGVSAGEDYFKAQNAYEEARISLQLATHKLKGLGFSEQDIQRLAERQNPNLRSYPIYAPISGTVIMRHITQGEYIENSTPIFEIADFNHVWVETGIYPKDLPQLREGQVVEIKNPETDQIAEGRLIYISPMISNETITAKIVARLDNSKGDWRPGSLVKVNIAVGEPPCPLLISKDAIQKIGGKECAFVETNKGFEKRELQLGKSDKKNIEIISGIIPGEKYVANRSFILKAEINKDEAHDDD